MGLKRASFDKANTLVKFKVVSTRGHDDYEESADRAVEHIRDICENEGKWSMIDGDFVNPEEITIDMLVESEDITLVNHLVGGASIS